MFFLYQREKDCWYFSDIWRRTNKSSCTKKNGNLENIGLVEKLPKTSHVKQQKRDDVKKLLKYFNIPPDAKDFYNDILNDEVTETSAEEDCQEYEKDIL